MNSDLVYIFHIVNFLSLFKMYVVTLILKVCPIYHHPGMSITQGLLRVSESQAPDLVNQDGHWNKISMRFRFTIKFEKHWCRRCFT